ncbi:MAG TPA: divalent-cation tolerance protein CutA [Maritimibacter sp.]|nr:divalent-cation tolerance protein CutA [Maritimibacter sp.]
MRAVEVQITFPSEDLAEATGAALVDIRLAACGQVTPITSVYRWKGTIEKGTEWLLTLKTVEDCVHGIETHVRDSHPYDVPQITALPVIGGSKDYIDWIVESVEA